MKKISLTIISLALAFCIAFSAMGCSQKTQLTFNKNFLGDQAASGSASGIIETLTYSVNMVDNYNDLIIKSSRITDNMAKYEFTEGKMITTLSSQSTLPDGIVTDINWSGSKIYHLQTDFSITANYTLNEEVCEPRTDTISSSCYFLSEGHSFAPIYSKHTVENTYLRLPTSEEEKAEIETYKYEYITSYNQNKYSMVNTVLGENPSSTTKEYDYTYRTIIDNTQLLFALRSFALKEETNHSLPVVAPSYGEEKTLAVSLKDTSTFRNNKGIAFGDKIANDIPINNVRYLINATENTGSYQFLKIQNAAAANLPFHAFVIEHAAPILAFGTFDCMGAMVYTLESVSLGN